MAAHCSEFNSVVEDIVSLHSFRGKVFTHWGGDVEGLLDVMEALLTRFKNAVTRVVMVWDHL